MKCSSILSKLSSVKSVLRKSEHRNAKDILEKTSVTLKQDIQIKQEADTVPLNDSEDSLGMVTIKQEPIDPDEVMETDEQVKTDEDIEAEATPCYFFKAKTAAQILAMLETSSDEVVKTTGNASVKELAACHGSFLEELRQQQMGPFLASLSQLCHRSTLLAHKIWVDLFPRIWDLLEEKHQMVLTGELGPFLCSGSHLHQTDSYRSSVNALVEGMANCSPAVPIRPIVLKYLGKTHNLWHRAALLLEESAVACEDMISVNPQLPIQQPWLDYGMFNSCYPYRLQEYA